MTVYNKYSEYLKEKYGDKVYKIPINIPVSCPNRDGNCGTGGCTFCAPVGAGYEMLDANETILDQLDKNIIYISKRYKAKYFIAYLQNYSNTYMPVEQFEAIIEELGETCIVGISVSTRPDCIHDQYLEALQRWQKKYKKDVCIELGLQTANYHTLGEINRGHGLAEYLDAVLRIKPYKFEICTHLILNLPWDDTMDVIENAKLMSVLEMNYVKLHALYILKNTKMGTDYQEGNIDMISLEAYKDRVALFLRYLDKNIVVQRLIGRAPEEYTLFANWNTSWWKIHDDIVENMNQKGHTQGDLCDYRNGKAVKRFVAQ
ncbi:MAG: TIGR01212 family radical SAM protein [Cellulosilyticaceae bacterium]